MTPLLNGQLNTSHGLAYVSQKPGVLPAFHGVASLKSQVASEERRSAHRNRALLCKAGLVMRIGFGGNFRHKFGHNRGGRHETGAMRMHQRE